MDIYYCSSLVGAQGLALDRSRGFGDLGNGEIESVQHGPNTQIQKLGMRVNNERNTKEDQRREPVKDFIFHSTNVTPLC